MTFRGDVYMFGGTDSDRNRQQNKCYYYDGKWHSMQSLQVNRSGHASVVVGEKILHFGGQGDTKSEVWTWTGKTKFSVETGVQFLGFSRIPFGIHTSARVKKYCSALTYGPYAMVRNLNLFLITIEV